MSSDDVGTTSDRHTAVVHVGTPSPYTEDDWVKTKVYFHRFADVPSTTEQVRSPSFHCLGHTWTLALYPRGDKKDTDWEDGMMSLYLIHHSNMLFPPILLRIEVGFAVIDFFGTPNATTTFAFWDDKHDHVCGLRKFMSHEVALHCRVHDTFVIEVRMRHVDYASPYIPENPSTRITAKDFFNTKEYADVIFEVGGEHNVQVGVKRRHTASLSSTKFYAHRMILSKAAPLLAEICGTAKFESPSFIEIPDTSPDRFKEMLLYVYGFKIPDFGKNIYQLKDLIELANKYGVIGLKLEAEVLYVEWLSFTIKNVMKHFSFAETMDCAYLREKAIDFMVRNSTKVIKRKLIKKDEGPRMSEIFAAVARSQARKKDEKELCVMSINELRYKAHEKGVDVDGSMETLIAALKSSDGDGDKESEEEEEEEEESEEEESEEEESESILI
jgi:hypothetical protein